jgi:isopentenyl phosphate kinase
MVKFPSDVFSHYVKLGITPITFGDVVVDKTKGMAICSGDDIMLRLAGDLNAKKSFFVTSVDGIFASYPPEENEKPLATVNTNKKIVFNSRDVDVTGSMERKLALMAKMAALGGKVFIVNGLVPRRLASALEGKEFLGTEVII